MKYCIAFLVAFLGGFVASHYYGGFQKAAGSLQPETASSGTRPRVSSQSPDLRDRPTFKSLIRIEGFEKLNFDELIASLEEIDARDKTINTALFDVLLARAAIINPLATFGYLNGKDWTTLSPATKETFFNIWAKADIDQAIAEIARLPNGKKKKESESRLFHACCEQQPEKALAILLENRQTIEKNDRWSTLDPMYSIFFNLVIKDKTQGLRALDLLQNEDDKATAMHGIISGIARTDLSDAISLADSSPDPDVRKKFLKLALREGMAIDPSSAIGLLSDATYGLNDDEKCEVLQESIRDLLDYKGREGINIILSNLGKGASRDRMEIMMLDQLIGTDPNGTVEELRKSHPDLFNEHAVSSDGALQEIFFRAIASQDPKSLFRWLTNSQTKFSVTALRPALSSIAEKDTKGVLNFVVKEMPIEDQGFLAGGILKEWFEKEPLGAAQWAGENLAQKGPLGNAHRARSTLISAAADSELFAGKQGYLGFGNEVQNVKDFALIWSAKEPAVAAQWAEKLDVPAFSEAAIDEISKRWIAQDSLSASKWIANLPYGTARRRAIQNLVAEIATKDSVAASQWQAVLDGENRKVGK